MADDLGFQPSAPAQSAGDDLGFQPVPKMPDTSGIKQIAQGNLAANDNVGKSPAQKLDTAVGEPVSSWLKGGNKDTPITPTSREQYIKSVQAGTANDFGDFMQSALHAAVPIVAGAVQNTMHPLDALENMGKSAISGMKSLPANLAADFSETARQDLTASGDIEPPISVARTGMPTGPEMVASATQGERGSLGAAASSLFWPVASVLAPAINPIIESTGGEPQKHGEPLQYRQTIPGVIGSVMDVVGMGALGAAHEIAQPRGPWDNHPGADAVKQPISESTKTPTASLSSDAIDQHIAMSTKGKAPLASDFKDVAIVTGANEKTLQVIFKQTGVKPDDVFEAARRNPEVLDDIRSGNVPDEFPIEPTSTAAPERLGVEPDKATSTFNVVDKDGDHVRGGFDSHEEARQYIDDKLQTEAIKKQMADVEKSNVKSHEAKSETKEPILSAEKAHATELDVAGNQGEQLAAANEGRLKPTAKQKAADDGLFDVAGRSQGDIFDQKSRTETETVSDASTRISKDSGVDVTLEDGSNNQIKLSGIKVPESQRGVGVGSRALKLVKDFADATGRNIVLTAQALSADKQVAVENFYKRNGFVKFGKDPLSDKPYYGYKAKSVAEKSKPNIIPPSEIGKPTSLRSFLSNNGAKFNEANELVSIKRDGKKIEGESALEYAHEITKEHNYLPKDGNAGVSRPITDLQNALAEKGGREVTREQDAGRVAKALEAEEARKNFDPVRIEHEAHAAGIDTSPVKGESERQFTKRLLKELNEFWKNQEGSGDTFRKIIGDSIIAAEKLTGKLTGDFFEKLGQAYIRTFQPELVSDKALRADAYLAKNKAKIQEAENAFYRASEIELKRWDRATEDQQKEWLYDHETGRWNEEENPDHARTQALYDAMRKAEQDAGVGNASYKENYLPHQYEKPDAVKTYFDSVIKKLGKDWFNKQSEFRLIQDADRAGFKMKTYNPERMLLDRRQASYNLIAQMDLLKDFESSGLATRTSMFTLDKKIAKTQDAIADLEKKYKTANDKINDPRQETWDFANPLVSKLMQTMAERLESLKSRLDDFNKQKSDSKLTPEQMTALKSGFKIIGPDSKAWNIHGDIAPLWKNAMDMKGLYEDQGLSGDAYRNYMAGKAVYVRTKMMASLFHPSHEVVIDLSSDLASAVHHLIQGGKISDLIDKKMLPNIGLGKYTAKLQDNPQVTSWNTAPELRTVEQKTHVDRMIEGGFVPTVPKQDIVNFKENFNKAINGIGKNNLRLLGTALEIPSLPMAPLMEHWIPGMKTESYFQRTDLVLARDPSLANDAGKRSEAFRKIAQDIERNYGEMNRNTQFWNPVVRDIFNATTFSGGWKLAMLQNFRGLAEPAKIAYNWAKTGEFSKAEITHQMLQSYIYTANMLMLGAGLNYMFTGAVGTIKDWVNPQTGDKNSDGTPIRLRQPAFFNEPIQLMHDIYSDGVVPGTGSFFYHQTLIPGIANSLLGRDFVGRPYITDPTDLHQWENMGLESISPIALSNQEKSEQKASSTAKWMGWVGFPMAGAYINQTPFEQKVIGTYYAMHPSEGGEYQSKLKAEMRGAVSNHDTQAQEKIENEMQHEQMKPSEIASAKKQYTTPFPSFAWSKLSSVDQKRLIESASPEEKQKFKIKSE